MTTEVLTKPKPVDHLNAATKHVLGITSPTWRWKSSERVDKTCKRDLGFIVVGSETTPITKGPRKGQLRWIGEENRVVLTRADLNAQLTRFESATGDCGECYGTGKTAGRVSVTKGTSYRACKRCAGSGRKP